MIFRTVVSALAATVVLSGCQVMKDSHEMRKTLDELNGKGSHIAKRADDLEREMKFKESTAMFAFAIELMFGENGKDGSNGMTDMANGETEIVLYAEMAIRSLMYQFWKGDYYEHSDASLDRDYDLAVSMFFTRIRSRIPESVDVTIPNRGFKAIGSLAARMEQVQPAFVEALKRRGLPTNLSLYEVIAQALADRNLPEQTGVLAKTKSKILQWQPEAIQLLQMRHNYLPMLVLSRLGSFGSRSNAGRALNSFWTEAVDLESKVPAKMVSNEQLREWTYWLNQALETRARLRALGIEPEYNGVMGRMLRVPDFGQARLAALAPVGQTVRQKLVSDFARAYMQVVEPMPSRLLPKIMPDIKWPDFSSAKPPFPAPLPPNKVM